MTSRSWQIATFYRFVALTDLPALRGELLAQGEALNLLGTILLAEEGINATIAGSPPQLQQFLDQLQQQGEWQNLSIKYAAADAPPFGKFKVKIKQEIVTLGQPQANPTIAVGQYISPQEWNALIGDPEVVVIDTRNDYEVAIGTFAGAINPHTEHFRQFPEYVQGHLDPEKHKKVAMFCTGGIRCEKATALLKQAGFFEVYHLQGGILNYLEQIPPEESLWQGECFVFDERVAVGHGLQESDYEMCAACGYPLSEADRQSPHYEVDICCPHCYQDQTSEKRDRQAIRHRQKQQQS